MATVPVYPGLLALVDDADLPLVAGSSWSRQVRKCGTIYAQAKRGGVVVLMHRLILAAPKGVQVDHANHNGLDNRRANIRLCTHQQNVFNSRRSHPPKSGFKGVFFDPGRNRTKPWRVRPTLNGKRRYLGRFASPEEAHEAYKAFISRHHGDFACPV